MYLMFPLSSPLSLFPDNTDIFRVTCSRLPFHIFYMLVPFSLLCNARDVSNNNVHGQFNFIYVLHFEIQEILRAYISASVSPLNVLPAFLPLTMPSHKRPSFTTIVLHI